MTIYIDADGCPVVNEAIRAAKESSVEIVLLCDSAHHMEREGVRTITVIKGSDSVDFELVNLVRPGDIVITQDYALAAMCLARRAIPMNQDGRRYTAENIDGLLAARHVAREIRRNGGRTRGPKKREAWQDKAFRSSLSSLLNEEADRPD